MLPRLHPQGVDRHVYQHRRPIVQYIYGEYHPILGNTLRPNLTGVHVQYQHYLDYSFRTNKDGFRGVDWDHSPARKNIIVLGDSFAFGWGVEEHEMFSSLLEARLRKVDPAFQVLNMAQSGYFLDQILNTFELFGRRFDPLLIVYLYCHNDPVDPPPLVNGKFDNETFRLNFSREQWNDEARLNNVNVWRLERFWEGSYTYAFCVNYLVPFFSADKSPQQKQVRKNRYHFTYKNLYPPNPPTIPISRDSIQQQYVWYCLDKLYRNSGQRPLILMDASDKVFVHMEDRVDSDRWLLRDFAALYENVFFLDFESEIRRKNDGIPMFLDVDDHWNADGHLLATQMIDEVVEKNLELFGVGKNEGH